MLPRKYFSCPQKTEILPENPVSETRNHILTTALQLEDKTKCSRNVFMSKSPRKNVPSVEMELGSLAFREALFPNYM